MESLRIIADNPELTKLLRVVFLDQFSVSDLDTESNNETLGEQVRAFLVAREGIESAFRVIENYKTIKENADEDMPAR